MKKSFLLIILVAISQFGFAQKQSYISYFSSETQIRKYLADNIVNLDPLEGIYDVQHIQKNGSPYAANHTENWTYFIVKDPSSNTFTIYTDYDYGICKSENVRIEQIGETNAYRIYYRNSSTRAYLENGIRLYAQINLSQSDAKYYADNPFFRYWITISYDLVKKYPNSSMYTNAVKEITDWTGTGFALNNNYIVTNYHVIEDAKSIFIQGINGDFKTKYNASIVATDKINDLALLQIIDNTFKGFGSIPYNIKTTVSEVGEDIFVLGYPLTTTMGDEIKLTTGVISSKTGFQGDVSLYQISAPIQPGNSGAPLFDENGNIIGIVSSKHIGAENVGYAIKTSYLKNLIESVLSENILPQTNKIASYKLSDKVKYLKNYVYYIICSKRESNTNDSTNDSRSQSSLPSTSMGNSKITD